MPLAGVRATVAGEGCESCERGCLFCAQATEFADCSDEGMGDDGADTGNGGKHSSASGKRRITLDKRSDRGFDPFDMGRDEAEHMSQFGF